MVDLVNTLERLFAAYGPQGWWPLASLAGAEGRDEGGYLLGPSRPGYPGDEGAPLRFEIAVGAVLAQNTSWRGASVAVKRLATSGLLSPEALLSANEQSLGDAIKTAGTFRIKRAYLIELAEAWPAIEIAGPSRESLLAIRGIGYETADCILLYCYGSPVFVADAYARRLLPRLGLANAKDGYESTRRLAESILPMDAAYLAEAHAVIDEHAKRRCKTKPICGTCPLREDCNYAEK